MGVGAFYVKVYVLPLVGLKGYALTYNRASDGVVGFGWGGLISLLMIAYLSLPKSFLTFGDDVGILFGCIFVVILHHFVITY